MNFLLSLFRPYTVQDAVAPLKRMQANLAYVVERRKAVAQYKNDQAANLTKSASADTEEAQRAERFLKRFEALLEE